MGWQSALAARLRVGGRAKRQKGGYSRFDSRVRPFGQATRDPFTWVAVEKIVSEHADSRRKPCGTGSEPAHDRAVPPELAVLAERDVSVRSGGKSARAGEEF